MKLLSNWQLARDMWDYIRHYKAKFWFGTVLRATSDLVWLFPPYAFSEIITFASHYKPGQPLDTFWWLIAGTWVASLYRYVTQDGAKFLIYQVSERIAVDAHLKSIAHLFRLDVVWHEKENSGNKMKRIWNGADSLNKLLRVYVDLVIESSINLVAILIVFYRLNATLDAILIVFFITYYLLSLSFSNWTGEQARRSKIEEENLEGITFEAINNIHTIKSLGVADRMMAYLNESARTLMIEVRKRIMRFRTRQSSLNYYKEVFKAAMLFFTIWQVLQGHFEVGVIALVMLYFNRIEASAQEFATVHQELITGKIAIQRVREMLDEKPVAETMGRKKFNPDWKTLSLDKLSFSYQGREVIKEFSLTIRRGEKIGLVGLSGAGKSTLFKLLLKLYVDYQGEIRFDDTEYKDIRRQSALDYLTIVPQETELFNLSLRDNITLSPQLSAAEKRRLDRSIDIAHVKDFLHKLDQGVDTLIGEKGVKLSGGEKQRVGLARAIYKEPQLLLLDEATSHLDVDSEKKIQAALHEFFKGITAVVIAHRLSTIREMDRIVVIDKGRALEVGTFDELMAAQGEFYRLWQKQRF